MNKTRRGALHVLLGVASAGVLSFRQPAFAQAATPDCVDGDEPTPRQTAGPFYTPNSPQRSSFLKPSEAGDPVTLQGRVLTQSCKPVAGALIDVWHADASGRYDLDGYRYRGHFFSGSDGTFSLETIRPGLYPGRTRHYHVRVQAPGGPILTTQLYFPGEAENAGDFLFRPELLMAVQHAEAGLKARFDFIVRT